MNMKIAYLFFLLIFPLSYSASALAGSEGHDVKIRIKGVPKDSMVRIGYYYGSNRYIVQDSARADANGLCRFKGEKLLPAGVYICTLKKGYFDFLVTSQAFTLETDTSDLELHMKIKGSPENTIFYEYHQYTVRMGRTADSINRILSKRKNADSVKMLKGKLNQMGRDVDSFRTVFMNKYPQSFSTKLLRSLPEPVVPETPKLENGKKDSTFPYRYFKTHYFDHIDFSDERIARTPFYESKLSYYFKNLVIPDPDSITRDAVNIIEKSRASDEMFKYNLSWIVNHYDESQFMGMDAVTSNLIERYFLTGQAKWVTPTQITGMRKRDSIVSHLLIGKTAPDLYMTDSNGKVITLYSVHHKYTLLYFWDATCGHCQHATPILHEFYEANKQKLDLEVYAATIERKTKDWKKYIREKKTGDWINVWDSFTVTDFNKMYDIYSTPVIYILDQNKKIIAKRLDVKQLEDFFDHLEHRDKSKIMPPMRKATEDDDPYPADK